MSSFALLPNDVTAKVLAPERDADGKLAALVKLVTAETGFDFDGGALGIVKVVPQVGEYWLYVPAKARTLTIKHPSLGVLRNYTYSVPIAEGNTYQLVLSTIKSTNGIEDISSSAWVEVISSIKDLPSVPDFDLHAESSEIIQTCGYLIGQQHTLANIRLKFPELKPQVAIAHSRFKLKFGRASDVLLASFRDALADGFDNFISGLAGKMAEAIDPDQITFKEAQEFLSEVVQRSEGHIDSPVLELLLSVQYNGDPLREMMDGFFYEFSTKDHPKAKNVELSIKLPMSWNVEPGNRPNIVAKFTPHVSDEIVVMIVGIFNLDLPSGYSLSYEDTMELLSDREFLAPLLAAVDEVDRLEQTKIEGLPALLLDSKTTIDRLESSTKLHSSRVIIPFKRVLIHLDLAYTASDGRVPKTWDDKRRKEFFMYLLNSLTIDSKWR